MNRGEQAVRAKKTRVAKSQMQEAHLRVTEFWFKVRFVENDVVL